MQTQEKSLCELLVCYSKCSRFLFNHQQSILTFYSNFTYFIPDLLHNYFFFPKTRLITQFSSKTRLYYTIYTQTQSLLLHSYLKPGILHQFYLKLQYTYYTMVTSVQSYYSSVKCILEVTAVAPVLANANLNLLTNILFLSFNKTVYLNHLRFTLKS